MSRWQEIFIEVLSKSNSCKEHAEQKYVLKTAVVLRGLKQMHKMTIHLCHPILWVQASCCLKSDQQNVRLLLSSTYNE